jgi:hypothetical protein
VLLSQFFALVGNRLWFYILLVYLGVQYSCGVVFSFFGSNLPENNVEPVPAKSELVQLCGSVDFFWFWRPPNLSCLQNNPPENNVEQFPPNLSCLQNNLPENYVEDLAGTRFKLFLSGLFWDRFLLDLRSFLALVLGTN